MAKPFRQLLDKLPQDRRERIEDRAQRLLMEAKAGVSAPAANGSGKLAPEAEVEGGGHFDQLCRVGHCEHGMSSRCLEL